MLTSSCIVFSTLQGLKSYLGQVRLTDFEVLLKNTSRCAKALQEIIPKKKIFEFRFFCARTLNETHNPRSTALGITLCYRSI